MIERALEVIGLLAAFAIYMLTMYSVFAGNYIGVVVDIACLGVLLYSTIWYDGEITWK